MKHFMSNFYLFLGIIVNWFVVHITDFHHFIIGANMFPEYQTHKEVCEVFDDPVMKELSFRFVYYTFKLENMWSFLRMSYEESFLKEEQQVQNLDSVFNVSVWMTKQPKLWIRYLEWVVHTVMYKLVDSFYRFVSEDYHDRHLPK